MGEIRIVGPGKTRGYPYPECKKSLSWTFFKITGSSVSAQTDGERIVLSECH